MTIEEFRKHRYVVQFLEYMVGGGLYFITGYAVFAICYSGFGWPWWVAKILGDTIGWTLNYIVQRYWAFNSKSLYRHELKNGIRYTVFSCINIGLDYLIIGGLREVGVTPYIGMLVAALFFTGWNYLGYRFWVFKKAYNTK
jgi:putative flippase GtrA